MPPWFRLYSEVLHCPKIALTARRLGLPRATVLGAWAALLALANDSPARGTLLAAEGEGYEPADLASEMGLDPDLAGGLLAHFERLGMLDRCGGAYRVCNWDRRQFVSDSSTERSRRSRHPEAGAAPPQRRSGAPEPDPDAEPQPDPDAEAADTDTQADDGLVDAVQGRRMLLEFGCGEPAASQQAGRPLDWIEGWIEAAEAMPGLRNPQGYVLAQLARGISPPPAPKPYERFISGPYADYIRH